MKAVLLVSHGAYSSKSTHEVASLTAQLKQLTGIPIFEYAFLEVETPDIAKGIDICVQKGATELLILLNFLNNGRHVVNDIPAIVKEAQAKHPAIKVSISQPIGQHPEIKRLFVGLINSQ